MPCSTIGDPDRFALPEFEPPRRARTRHPFQPECTQLQARRKLPRSLQTGPANCPAMIPTNPNVDVERSARGRRKEICEKTLLSMPRNGMRNRRRIRAVAGCQCRPTSSPLPIQFRSIDASRSSSLPIGTSSHSYLFRTAVRSGGCALELWSQHQLDVPPEAGDMLQN